MKSFFLITLILSTMVTYGQQAVAPPTPPTPPATSATSTGIVHAKSITSNAYAFSCTFNPSLKKKMVKIISNEFKKFSKEFVGTKFIKEIANEYYYKIELKKSELKLECRLEDASDKDRKKLIKRFSNIEEAILAL